MNKIKESTKHLEASQKIQRQKVKAPTLLFVLTLGALFPSCCQDCDVVEFGMDCKKLNNN